MATETSRLYNHHQGRKRTSPIPVAPPRIPTPMPLNNNNAPPLPQKSLHSNKDNMKVHPTNASVGSDIPKLITKASYKLLDNDVKTAWINPRLISKLDMEIIKSTDYKPPLQSTERKSNKMLTQRNHRQTTSLVYHQHYHSSKTHHLQQQPLQTFERTTKEWENALNGRGSPAADRITPAIAGNIQSVPASTCIPSDGLPKRSRKNRSGGMEPIDKHSVNNNKYFERINLSAGLVQGRQPAINKLPSTNSRIPSLTNAPAAKIKTNKVRQLQPPKFYNQQERSSAVKLSPHVNVTYHQHHQSAAGCYVGASSPAPGYHASSVPTSSDMCNSVYGVYSETKYTFAVNGLPGCYAQASTAAAFFARAAQKLNLSSSPRRKKYVEDAEATGFCGVLQKTPPPVPPALLRRIGVKEVTGVGKVKVMLRVSNPSNGSSQTEAGCKSFFSLDKRKKQVTLVDPTTSGGSSAAPEDRRVGVAAPKMFAFDAIFSHDDSQTEVCSSALTDVVHAVINGTDGCLFCFGHAGLGKSYTMLGTPESANTLGIIPCAISWLFKGINEQKQKTGARFSVRVSAVEISGPTNQLRDLLAGYSNENEQSPGVYLRDDPLLGSQPAHCELRVPTAEKAAHYLDAALESRAPHRGEDTRDTHLLYTLHVYQYSVAGKGGVAGGRSRLHLIDLGNSERGKASGGIPLSGLGNILLAIFNGQKHLPYKENKLTHLLKDCLSSLTCHAAMIVHISPNAQNYAETLTTVQLASRIHRMRRRRIKFVNAATGNGSGGSSGEDAARTTGTSSEPDPSSSDLSADTVIYVGPHDDATDCEHPPVYIPSLNSGDNRCSMSKALRGSSAEQRPTIKSNSPLRDDLNKRPIKSTTSTPRGSPKSSPSKLPMKSSKTNSAGGSQQQTGASDEQWIDGPKISKSKLAEARHLMKEPCHVKKRETWIDGPMQAQKVAQAQTPEQGYGFMDSHKKNMIRKWVEHQTTQIQRSSKHKGEKHREPPKELTQFKTFDDEVKPLETRKVDNVNECTIRTGLKLSSKSNDTIPEATAEQHRVEEQEEEEELVEIPPALPLIQPLSSREVSLESLDILLKERMLSNAEYNYQNSIHDSEHNDMGSDEDEILEIIEVEEPLEPVPTQDCCLQVTEEDIAYCMGLSNENPLPEVDQENRLDHPLRILSQENLTVVSTFTDSMSVYTDLERILPRHRYDPRYGFYNDDYEDPDNPYHRNGNMDEHTQKKFDQLAKLHELYSNRLAKANVANSETYQQQKGQNKVMTRCESLSLNDMLYGDGGVLHDNSSIYSEPAYIQDKFCENCKVHITPRPQTAQTWYAQTDPFLAISASTHDLSQVTTKPPQISSRFQRYCHNYKDNLANLRHPDGASNPNLRDESDDVQRASTSETVLAPIINKPPPNTLPSIERMNRAILSLETGVAAIKLTHKSEEYDSGHDSTPRTSKHSPAALSRRAESGYDSVVRDSESSSIDSDTSRISHNRKVLIGCSFCFSSQGTQKRVCVKKVTTTTASTNANNKNVVKIYLSHLYKKYSPF